LGSLPCEFGDLGLPVWFLLTVTFGLAPLEFELFVLVAVAILLLVKKPCGYETIVGSDLLLAGPRVPTVLLVGKSSLLFSF
jgi:hypothetical protein